MATRITPDFDWNRFVNELFSFVDMKIPSSTKAALPGLPYLMKFMKILNKYENR